MKETKATKEKEIVRAWHLIDARGQVLGRISTQIARLLLGKDKANWAPYLDMGDFVVVINAEDVKVTGKKEEQKEYYRYSGYPGGLRKETLGEMRRRKPTEIIRLAVKGMLPDTKIGKKMITKLHIYAGHEGPMVEKAQKQDGK